MHGVLAILADGHDLKTSVGQGFNDAFRDLLGFLGIHSMVWLIIPGIANCRGDYRIHLVLISHRRSPDHYPIPRAHQSADCCPKKKGAEVLTPLADALDFLVDHRIFGADRSVSRHRRALRFRSVDAAAGGRSSRGRSTGARVAR